MEWSRSLSKATVVQEYQEVVEGLEPRESGPRLPTSYCHGKERWFSYTSWGFFLREGRAHHVLFWAYHVYLFFLFPHLLLAYLPFEVPWFLQSPGGPVLSWVKILHFPSWNLSSAPWKVSFAKFFPISYFYVSPSLIFFVSSIVFTYHGQLILSWTAFI